MCVVYSNRNVRFRLSITQSKMHNVVEHARSSQCRVFSRQAQASDGEFDFYLRMVDPWTDVGVQHSWGQANIFFSSAV